MRAPRRPDSLFWVDPARVAGSRLTLDAEESRHLLRVFRAETGTLFEATDGAGIHYACRLVDEHHGEARAEILSRTEGAGEYAPAIHLLVGLPETRAVEVIVEHAVPLGVASIVFAACRRSGRDELGEAKMERMERIAIAGVKQSLRSRLPILGTTPNLQTALEAVPRGPRFVADVAGGGPIDGLKDSPQLPVTLAVGPPGGFDDGEAASLRAADFQPISLGPSRLTTETASLAILGVARNAIIYNKLPPI
ncbi:MAG TPA: RsmE family RNA methyltransferase [Candidatus Eisenbacteria bacterium]|nr:RsmE family RNA methyltransferase [Candidatus Eisenbacteria bacterium]